MKKKLIYTSGATGFIGKNFLPPLLNAYDEVINFTSKESIQIYTKNKVIEKEISVDFLKSKPGNEFFNLATLHIPNPSSISEMKSVFDANILFPMRTLEYLQIFDNLKLINVLSYTQLLDFSSQNIYSLSKEIFKKFIFFNHSSHVTNLYLFDTFGDGDNRNKVTDVFIRNILSGSSITIPKNEVRINLTHNSAISESLLESISLDPGEYCIKSPDSISLENLAYLIMDIAGKKVQIFKKNSAVDPLKLIQSFPENVFINPKGYNFRNQLESRIQEILKNEF
jgi:nucleoside-diphosphate-sugar epimerase